MAGNLMKIKYIFVRMKFAMFKWIEHEAGI